MDKDGHVKIKTNMLKELNYLNDWLKSRHPKKMSIKAKDLNDEFKIMKNSSSYLKDKMEQHLYDKASIFKKTIDNKIDNIKVFDNFIKIVRPEFKDNTVVMKFIDETVKLHNDYNNDLEKARNIIAKL
jgi:hypothetical protein